MQEQNPCRMLTLHNLECTRQVGRPAIRWLDSREEDLEILEIGDEICRIWTSGEQSWKRSNFTVDCSANRRRRLHDVNVPIKYGFKSLLFSN
jgi:hypothetical protein